MLVYSVILGVFIIGLLGLFLAFYRARSIEARGQKMHSRPIYYGWWVFLLSVVPAVVFLGIWSFASTVYVEYEALSSIPAVEANGAPVNKEVSLDAVYRMAPFAAAWPESMRYDDYSNVRPALVAQGIFLPEGAYSGSVFIAYSLSYTIGGLKIVGALIASVLAVGGLIFGLTQVAAQKRARNKVELMVVVALVIASIIAILTTIGIVCSMLFQTIHFFQSVSFSNFFFGTVWDPRFAGAGASGAVGQFGLIPLLAGTLYIAFVAMLFAVPIGLFAAIYMSEYASARLRGIVKPLLEVLAGIPTIVYGFFALSVVGPFLRDISTALAGGHTFIQAQSVLTAGLVMGIMLIPFVSSLSDDIINAVPNSLRDGSYGLGATQSETIKRVVMPAALPGIVSALLLTASRAVGETMIVVLAAGVAANLNINPFEPMTTMTVKIVNQLTGDLEFNSPQTLVAFALGMTLFVLTFLMNVYALYIVRKYREQYE